MAKADSDAGADDDSFDFRGVALDANTGFGTSDVAVTDSAGFEAAGVFAAGSVIGFTVDAGFVGADSAPAFGCGDDDAAGFGAGEGAGLGVVDVLGFALDDVAGDPSFDVIAAPGCGVAGATVTGVGVGLGAVAVFDCGAAAGLSGFEVVEDAGLGTGVDPAVDEDALGAAGFDGVAVDFDGADAAAGFFGAGADVVADVLAAGTDTADVAPDADGDAAAGADATTGAGSGLISVNVATEP